MEVLEAIRTRRSIRKYRDEPVPEDVLQQITQAAMYAPSACNQQPWQFLVVDNRRLLREVPEIHPYAAMAAEAPLVILVCGDTSLEVFSGYWVIDCSAQTASIGTPGEGRRA